jgi:hypothetical protein
MSSAEMARSRSKISRACPSTGAASVGRESPSRHRPLAEDNPIVIRLLLSEKPDRPSSESRPEQPALIRCANIAGRGQSMPLCRYRVASPGSGCALRE